SRISTYDSLLDGTWEKSVAEIGMWSKEIVPHMLKNYGFNDSINLVKKLSVISNTECSIFLHYGHATQNRIDDAFSTSSRNILAPSVVVSSGCHTAYIDNPYDHNSIVKHLFQMGSVGFIGSPRYSTAIGAQIHHAFFNKILEGEPLGKAYQHGITSLTLSWLRSDQNDASFERERLNMMFLGDPALVIHVPGAPEIAPATLTSNGNQVEITIPQTDWVSPLDPLTTQEWGYNGNLYLATIPGVEATTYWGAGGYDEEDHYFMAKYDTAENVQSVTQNETFQNPLGKSGSYFVDYHQDGSKSILWHVRVMDFDQETGSKNSVLNKVTYTIGY
ncbi:MAG: hypothetical protein GY816_20050, partial [Cytophagales bacterium]|nr:hypothetical protein [Cytophagales bacterium]